MLIKMPHFSEYSDDEPFLRADYLCRLRDATNLVKT